MLSLLGVIIALAVIIIVIRKRIKAVDFVSALILGALIVGIFSLKKIDFVDILNTLNSIGYQGFVSAEILPLPDPDTAAGKTVEYMRRMAS